MAAHRTATAFILALSLGCVPKIPELPADFDATAGPVIPAMVAPMYATGHGLPKDPLTAQVALGHPWSEALSGAAAAVGLETELPPTIELAQHAAHRAGYPYPVKSLSVGWLAAGDYPNELADKLGSVLREGDHLGLARVRTHSKDRWVALIAHPVDRIDPIPREMRIGTDLRIRTATPTRWKLVSPTGRLLSGTTPAAPSLDEQGEWWLEVQSLNALVASVPLYVDMATPAGPVLDLPGEQADGPSDASILAVELIGDIRESFALPGLALDGTLQTLAYYPLKQVLEGSWTADGGVARLRGAGFVGGPATQVHCSGPSVAACLDRLMSEANGRSALLNRAFRLTGTAAQVRTDGVTLVINLASE